MKGEAELIEGIVLRVGMKSLMNHGAASCVYSEGCAGVTQQDLLAFTREVALHCFAALGSADVDADVRIESLSQALREIRDIAQGSTTANSLPHLAKIAAGALEAA